MSLSPNLYFHPFVVVSRYRDPQLQVGENLKPRMFQNAYAIPRHVLFTYSVPPKVMLQNILCRPI